MNVSPDKPFQIVYSLYQHNFLGFLFESFIVELNEKEQFTLRYQNIASANAYEFAKGLDETDFQLIKLTDDIRQDTILKKFSNKKLTPEAFFYTLYDKEKGDEKVQEAIDDYLEKRRAEILEKLQGKFLFEMGNDGNPTHQRITIEPQQASVKFHFRRNEKETEYFPTVQHKGEKLKFQYLQGSVICFKPAWLLLKNHLYRFDDYVDGHKLKPFLNKGCIQIPRKVEQEYFRKFVVPLIQHYDVGAYGLVQIDQKREQPQAVLKMSELPRMQPATLFDDGQGDAPEDDKMLFQLFFRYGDYTIAADPVEAVSVEMRQDKENDRYVFYKISRNKLMELAARQKLQNLGISTRCTQAKGEAFSWLKNNWQALKDVGIEVEQVSHNGKRYFLGESQITLKIAETHDWFDIDALVHFGDYEMPFSRLRRMILGNKREFALPNGEIAVIPEEWFTQYRDLIHFSEENGEGANLKKHHFALLRELQEGNLAQVNFSERLGKLRDFERIEDLPLPHDFKGELRPYQKAGYNWMNFLGQYGFGGCLADDMGLGKTIQTLALLQQQKELNPGQPSLLVMPTSLLYNWEMEAKKFTPKLRIYQHSGSNRTKNVSLFGVFDVIITSYGVTRVDIDLFESFYFNYIILDESQAIKNPTSIISKAAMRLKARKKLILTGTPIENSTLDLWTQMNFINPGLLGTQAYFQKEFLVPIEKKQDEQKLRKLHAIIKPFILRRHKSQVATELPAKIENVQYCDMTPEQEHEYEQTKSAYRNQIMQLMESDTLQQSQLMVLQGLTYLRQLANHPKMVKDDYTGDSGKLDDVLHKLDNIITKNHKVLIFSQFVKYLQIVKEHLDKRKVSYAYLDGTTKNRQEAVEDFQRNKQKQIFLISLKAGGVGLNLTAADYVFILDPWWNPAVEAQAIDRAHRIGQTNTVMIYKFITRNSVEEKILLLQQNKAKLAGDLITTEESFVKKLTKDDIKQLFT